MNLSQLSYDLPRELIANTPASPRDHSRLLALNRQTGTISHKHFYDLSDILCAGDVLVLNNTKVFPARVFGKKISGGAVEVLFTKNMGGNIWEILGKNLPAVSGQVNFNNFYAIVVEKATNTAMVEVHTNGENLLNLLEKEGQAPVPPYIKTHLDEKTVRQKYQTVYAEKEGSVAAPTAGLHFTNRLLAKLKKKKVVIEYVTLHVGMGTFSPIKAPDITKHKMHSEHYSIGLPAAKRLWKYKKEGKRIVAVGTTAARVLETVYRFYRPGNIGNSRMTATEGETDIFIYPPYKFNFVDALITNFHLPHSTLLAMISAFVSKPNTEHKFTDFRASPAGKAYTEAIKKKYRFYSFGDAMMIA